MHPSNMIEVDAALKKKKGDGIGGRGPDFIEFDRLPSGIFSLDVALGGGLPLGAVSIVFGHEGANKTSLCLRWVTQFQKRYPQDAVAWIDAENSWTNEWAVKHGVDIERIHVYKATTAEDAVDVADAVAFAEDAGLLVVDSLAALATLEQLEKEGEQVVMGGSSRKLKDLMLKVGAAHTEHSKRKHRLTTIYINQIRHKIGFVMGNPEILPGPSYQNFQAFLKLRLTAKPKIVEKIAPVPIYSENGAKITKHKFPVCSTTSEWMTMRFAHDGWKPLDVNNAKLAEKILTDEGAIAKHEKSWTLFGELFDTKKAAVEAALEDYDCTVKLLVKQILQGAAGG